MFLLVRYILKKIARLLTFFISITSIVIITFYLFTPDIKALIHLNPTTTAFMEIYKKKAEEKGEVSNIQSKWVPLNEISPLLIKTILHTEDASFWNHHGFDWCQIKQAFKIIWKQHKIVTGGSTITQQLAKNLYLYPDRTIFRKCYESIITYSLEKHLSKKRILEIYLNVIEWGDGIFGIEAASQHWFQTSAIKLTPTQAVSLALVLPNPHKRNPTNLPIRLIMHANSLLMKFFKDSTITKKELIESIMIPKEYFIEEEIQL